MASMFAKMNELPPEERREVSKAVDDALDTMIALLTIMERNPKLLLNRDQNNL